MMHQWRILAPLQTISKNGYLYVYVSNESPQDVYFDDITVKHFTGALLQEQSYYPFGVEMASISDKAMNKLSSAYKFNGGDEIEESISMYSTFYRQYDQQLGRFMGMDILSEEAIGMSNYHFSANNPIMFRDPMGDKEESSEDKNYSSQWAWIINGLMNADMGYGASWSPSGGFSSFSSQDEAFGAGVWAMNSGGGWGANPGWAGSFSEALSRFNGGKITPEMVEAYFSREWGTSGKYNIHADYATGAREGQGFKVSWAFDPGIQGSGQTMSTVGIGRMYVSNATIERLMGDEQQSWWDIATTVSENYDRAMIGTSDMMVGSMYLSKTLNGETFKLLGDLPLLKQVNVVSTAINTYNHISNFIKDPNWKDGLEALGNMSILAAHVLFPEADLAIDTAEFIYNNGDHYN